ncbi:Male sterility NAD-binding [Penicillium hetheringtonii]|uniref:Male sterility NAD-binding n=1 Tax=Penicillium hetheringtonii TaxID=911720 RepID=A0AAD6E4F6_9EURO|nr:Male sterility NAD-binding [Penicillium hetheringtonii]
MESILVQVANDAPQSTAVIEDDREISYQTLIKKADLLVQALKSQDFANEEPVCVFLHPGIQQIISQVAILRAGGTVVPIHPDMPAKRVSDMLRDIDLHLVVTNRDLAKQFTDSKVMAVEDILEQEGNTGKCKEIHVQAGCPEGHRSHILFTSGSTGKPKPIEIRAASILHVINYFPGPTLTASDRMTAFINPGFDLSLLEVWMPLLRGAAVVQVPKLIATDPLALKGFLDKNKVKAMVVPAAIFNVIAHVMPDTFSGQRNVLLGGERANAAAVKKVLEGGSPEHLWNIYGPTEATIYVTIHLIDLEECEFDDISIGRPVGHTKVHLLDEHMRPVTAIRAAGEICVSGPQLSSGYLNMPDESNKKFIYLDSGDLGGEPGESIRVYRTGDLGQWRDSTGLLDYIGRTDNQIKRDGNRIELGDIESTLENHPQVFSCTVIQSTSETSDHLTAYVIPEDTSRECEKDQIIQWAKEQLPPYMIPDTIDIRNEFPLTPAGKVDRKALAEEGQTQNHNVETRSSEESQTEPTDGDNVKWLQSKIKNYLGVSHIRPDDNVFSLGLSSLQAAQFLGEILHHTGVSITMAQLHEKPLYKNLSALLNVSRGTPDSHSQVLKWERDSHLADEIAAPADWISEGEGRVFLTGGTGFLGAYLLSSLLEMPCVRQVACLARHRGSMTAKDRIRQTLQKYELWDNCSEMMQKVIVLDGELANDDLGIGRDKFYWLANWASVVFHVAARVNWCEPYEAHYEPNVIGTKNIIRLAVQGRRKSLQYVSSIDVWNVTGFINKVERVFEDEPLSRHAGSLPYDMGYSQSQWVVEEMIQRSRARGLPVIIHRPGFIIGDRSRAIGNPDDFFGRMIVGCIQCGNFPYLPSQRLEWVTVDYVCSAILHIASKNDNLGRSYHLVSTDPTQSVSMERTCEIINEAGFSVEQVPYNDWVEKIKSSPGNPLESMVPLLQESVLGNNSRIQTGTYNPIYDAQNTTRALRDRPDIRYKALDADLLRRLVDYWVNRGDFSI